MGLIAERALAAGFGEAEKDSRSPARISGSRAQRYQVMLHVDESTLREDALAERVQEVRPAIVDGLAQQIDVVVEVPVHGSGGDAGATGDGSQ